MQILVYRKLICIELIGVLQDKCFISLADNRLTGESRYPSNRSRDGRWMDPTFVGDSIVGKNVDSLVSQ